MTQHGAWGSSLYTIAQRLNWVLCSAVGARHQSPCSALDTGSKPPSTLCSALDNTMLRS